jgi:hypothetical protein
MTTDHIRYDILAQEALRGVVRTVLADAAKKGLVGEHHFKIAFDTRAPGVRLSQRMREQYPEEMTIVLQYQFWDLTVSDDAFEVGLSFGGVPERLRVPFDAINGFFDPSVEFALQFAVITEEEEAEDEPPAAKVESRVRRPAERKPAPSSGRSTVTPLHPPQDTEPENDPDNPGGGGGGEVVRLDRFRKK